MRLGRLFLMPNQKPSDLDLSLEKAGLSGPKHIQTSGRLDVHYHNLSTS